jgi:aspartate-semialdehyde dehydrogenase
VSGQSEGLRIGVVGATGALGGEVLAVLDQSSLPVAELVPVATDHSLGEEIAFQGVEYPVFTEPPRTGSLDLIFLCVPAGVALEYTREALKAEVPCIDASGALCGVPEVMPRVAAFGPLESPEAQPLLVAPPGAALPLALALRPLAEAAGLRRVVGTVLLAASAAGRIGIESLYQESVALFNQDDFPEPRVFPRPLAFDCIPAVGEVGESGATEGEQASASVLARVLPVKDGVALTHVHVPVFVGFGATAALETEQQLTPLEAAEILAKAPGVDLWREDPGGLTLRAVAGREEVVVGRIRQDPGAPHGLQLWVAADPLRVSAVNAVALAVARIARHH